jgi:hypothetical protein
LLPILYLWNGNPLRKSSSDVTNSVLVDWKSWLTAGQSIRGPVVRNLTGWRLLSRSDLPLCCVYPTVGSDILWSESLTG